MRGLVAGTLAAIGALVLAPTALARSLTVTAPSSVQEEHTIPVHVSGAADEPELAWTAFVQNEACPATLVDAQNQPDAVKQNKTQLQPGAFSFDSTLSSIVGRPPGRALTGIVNVCS